jgi:long-chain fatty acid transport protein
MSRLIKSVEKDAFKTLYGGHASMKRNFARACVALGLAALIMAPRVVYATDGYFENGYGTISKGMGGVGVAYPQDAMAAAINPAGLVFIGNRFDIGAALFIPERSYSVQGNPSGQPGTFGLTPGTVGSNQDFFGNPHLATNHMLTPNSSFGFTLYGNGGMNTNYPAISNGKGMPTGTFYGGSTGVDLSQLYMIPSYSRKFNNKASWGVSLILAYQQFSAKGLSAFGNFVSDGTPDNLTNRGYDHSFGYGGEFGVMGEVIPNLRLGLAYQTKIVMQKFPKYQDLFADNGGFDIPQNATVGLAWNESPRNLIEFDVQKIWYSQVHSIGNPFSNLLIGIATNDPNDLLGGSNGAGFGWRDVVVYKLGFQRQVSSSWTVRAGLDYCRQPIPSSEVLFNILAPGVQEWHITTGFTKKLNSKDDFSMSLMYSPPSSVSGPNPMEVPGQQTISLRMYQWEVEANYGIHW